MLSLLSCRQKIFRDNGASFLDSWRGIYRKIKQKWKHEKNQELEARFPKNGWMKETSKES